MDPSGFVPIVAMFYSLFHPTEGTKVRHQVPTGSIIPPSDRSYDTSAFAKPLFDFDSIKNYVIPKPALCNRLLTVKVGNYRVVGFPIRISGEHYNRNFFTFNMCFVFEYESDTTPYEATIKRIGRMLRALEEQSQMFSKAEKDEIYFNLEHPKQRISSRELEDALGNNKDIVEDSRYFKVVQDDEELDNQLILEKNTPGQKKVNLLKLSSIESLIQQIFQDLNNYSECMIPIDSSNSVDVKLFPIKPPPPALTQADVPIAIVTLETMVDSCWDPTMLKILPFINGVNTIQKISELADTEFEFTKRCIQELMHYQAIDIVDIFQFSNIYATTSQISTFLTHPRMSLECQEYVISTTGTFNGLPLRHKRMSGSNSELDNFDAVTGSGSSPSKQLHMLTMSAGEVGMSASPGTSYPNMYNNGTAFSQNTSTQRQKKTILTLPSTADLFKLYTYMNQRKTLKEWYIQNEQLLKHIDVRRFVTFGILKGIIYRVKYYPISTKLVNDLNMGASSFMYGRAKRLSSNHRRLRESKNYNISTIPITVTTSDKKNGNSSSKGISENGEGEGEDSFVDINQIQNERLKHREELELIKMMKNTNDFDLICSKMRKTRKEVITLLNGTKEDYHIVHL